MKKFLIVVGLIVLWIGVWLGILALIAYPIQYCWNKTLPNLMNVKEITHMQAFYLELLCVFLIGPAIGPSTYAIRQEIKKI